MAGGRERTGTTNRRGKGINPVLYEGTNCCARTRDEGTAEEHRSLLHFNEGCVRCRFRAIARKCSSSDHGKPWERWHIGTTSDGVGGTARMSPEGLDPGHVWRTQGTDVLTREKGTKTNPKRL